MAVSKYGNLGRCVRSTFHALCPYQPFWGHTARSLAILGCVVGLDTCPLTLDKSCFFIV